MKEALNGSTHRHFPATTWVCRARRSLPKTRTQVGTCPSGVEGGMYSPARGAACEPSPAGSTERQLTWSPREKQRLVHAPAL